MLDYVNKRKNVLLYEVNKHVLNSDVSQPSDTYRLVVARATGSLRLSFKKTTTTN